MGWQAESDGTRDSRSKAAHRGGDEKSAREKRKIEISEDLLIPGAD
jgi:hypothetical protein